jgi:aldehyde dehydrogenase (NAD+)
MNFAAIVERQRAYVSSGATYPLEFRRAQLIKLGRAIETHEPLLRGALYADLRKSAYEAYGTEIGLVLGEIRHALRHLAAWTKLRRRRTPLLAWPAQGFIRPEP